MGHSGQHIEGKLAAHDRHQFELKLGYTLNPDLFKNNYNIELYLFIPKSLGMNRYTYAKEKFYGDLKGYIRFKTPMFTFDSLLDTQNQLSPLTRIKNLLNSPSDTRTLIGELKLFACTLRVALRNDIITLRRRIRKNDTENIAQMLKATCSGLTDCLNELRKLFPMVEQPEVHEDLRTAFHHADEFLGIAADALLNSFHSTIIISHLPPSIINELSAIVAPVITDEYNYRLKHGYAIYKKDSENDLFLYRKGILKKIITSILFLETHTEEGATFAKDIIFGVAAGIAMLLFVTLTLWAGHRWSATSLPFAVVLVIGYIAKDRLKDWCKLLFSKKMTRWMSDYKTDIADSVTGRSIGVCRHAFSFLSEKKIPHDIMLLRRQNRSADFWVPEDIIKYEKDVTIKPAQILKSHARRRDITDIIRFNIRHFLERMDEPFEIRHAIDAETGNMAEFKCARVYHINIILKLANETHRMRLVMDQNGIKRLEEIKV